MQSIPVFLDITNLLISGEKILMSAEVRGCHVIDIFLGCSLGKV